ncbi:keratin, type II cytoskeletal 1-like [Armigeres subalbatus]|uniref:keratin, type II cytoskeletal 1-like n=1 Tax=Armigeres subalbatus TaxID=124917 RepID=UPI002ED6411E
MYDGVLRLNIPPGVKLVRFADGVTMTVYGESIEEVELTATYLISLGEEWLCSKKLINRGVGVGYGRDSGNSSGIGDGSSRNESGGNGGADDRSNSGCGSGGGGCGGGSSGGGGSGGGSSGGGSSGGGSSGGGGNGGGDGRSGGGDDGVSGDRGHSNCMVKVITIQGSIELRFNISHCIVSSIGTK